MEVADLLEECIDTLATATAQWDRWRCTTVYVTTSSQAGRQSRPCSRAPLTRLLPLPPAWVAAHGPRALSATSRGSTSGCTSKRSR